MVINPNCDSATWRELVRTSPQGSIFSDDRFLRSATLDVELVTIESKGEILFGCPIAKHKGAAVGKQWPFVQYHGPLLSEQICHLPIHGTAHRQLEAANLFLEYMERRTDRIWFNFHHQYPDVRAYSWFHYHDRAEEQFRFRPLYTGIIDLHRYRNLEHYLCEVRQLRSRQYMRSSKSGYAISRSQDLALLDELHRLTFERQGIRRDPRDVEIMLGICNKALLEGYGDLFFIHDPEGLCASGTFFLRDEHSAYYLIGANDPAHRKSGASTHLLIDVFWKYQEQGIRYIDLVGINSPNRGDFKTSLNASPKLYFQACWEKRQD